MSAKVGKLIYGLLANSTNVASAVGTRIYPNVAPLNAAQTFPYLVYKIITTESTDTKGNLADWDPVLAGPTDRRSPLDIIQIQVSTFGINYNTTADLAHDVRLALDRTVGSGFTAYGIVVDSMIYAGESGLYESDVKPEGVYHVAQTYSVRVINTAMHIPAFANYYSCEFNGTDQYVNLGDPPPAIFSFGDGSTDTPFSISLWFKADVIQNASALVGKNSVNNSEYEVRFGSGGTGDGLRFRVYDESSSKYMQTRTNDTFITGQWYHLGCTYDGSGTDSGLSLYVNAVVGSASNLDTGYTAMENLAAPLTIGQVNGTYFDGNIDEVALFSKELSASEVLAMYNLGTPTDLSGDANLIGWWRMGDAGAYPVINDSSTNANSGTMILMSPSDIENVIP